MSKKQKTYPAEFKTKVVLEVLSGDQTISEIASKYSLNSKSIQNWKKTFLANARFAFDSESAVADIKADVQEKKKQIDELHRQLGKRTAELEWASKKLKRLDCDVKRTLIQSELKEISVSKQCELTGFNRSRYYYSPAEPSEKKQAALKEIDLIYSELPFFGYRKIHRQLSESGIQVGINQVASYIKELGLKAIYPEKRHQTTQFNANHEKYPYLLKGLDIDKPNQVWSTDLTYIRMNGGFVYLAAIIDWYSKAILSYKISNTMDEHLVLEVLHDALNH